MSQIQEIATTLKRLANPKIKRKDLIFAVREEHSGASKKDVARAAFYVIKASAKKKSKPIKKAKPSGERRADNSH